MGFVGNEKFDKKIFQFLYKYHGLGDTEGTLRHMF